MKNKNGKSIEAVRERERERELHFSKIRKAKGITLVSLVVTLIILLILAGISIASLTENGFFEKAKLAKEKQTNAQLQENATLGNYENKIGEYLTTNRDKINNGLVAFYNTVYHDATTSERYITIEDYNEEFEKVDDNTIMIDKPGTYTAYITVGHSPNASRYTTSGTLYINDEVTDGISQNYINTEGTKGYKFSVGNGERKKIKYTIYTDGNFSTGRITVFGSLIIIRNS